MTEAQILGILGEKLKGKCGKKFVKFKNDVARALVRAELARAGFIVSEPDVYLQHHEDVQHDLFLLSETAQPVEHKTYRPEDVRAVIAIKLNGLYAASAIRHCNHLMTSLHQHYPHLQFVFLIIQESIYNKDDKSLQCPTFALSYFKDHRCKIPNSDEWPRFIDCLKRIPA